MTATEWDARCAQTAQELAERYPDLWAIAQNALANREQWEQERRAEEHHAKEAIVSRQHTQKTLEELETARTADLRAQCYARRGELLREAHRLRRQEQHCEKCGHRFNYR
jgi:hypothetical protein